MLFPLELAAARAVGALSRLSGRGGGTTLPGKLLVTVDPGAVARLAAALPGGCALVSATNGKTTTTAMAAELVGGRLAYNRSGANLLSGVASALLAASDAELGLFECDEAALPVVARRLHPRLIALGNLFRDQLDRYGELELVAAGWRSLLADQPESCSSSTSTIHSLPSSTRSRPGPACATASTIRRTDAPCSPTRPTRAAALPARHRSPTTRSTSATWVHGAARAAAAPARRSTSPPARSSCAGSRAAPSRSPTGTSHGAASSRCPVSTTSTTPRLPPRSPSRSAPTAARSPSGCAVSYRRSAASNESWSASARCSCSIKNSAGANEAIATLLDGSPPTLALVALNDELADGRDVSWIWDVDFEPLLGGLERVVVSGSRAEELALRFAYGGLARERIDVVPALEQALDRGLELTPTGAELVVLPTYTAMLVLRRLLGRRAHLPAYWEARA